MINKSEHSIYEKLGNCPLGCGEFVRIRIDFMSPVNEEHMKIFWRHYIEEEYESLKSNECTRKP